MNLPPSHNENGQMESPLTGANESSPAPQGSSGYAGAHTGRNPPLQSPPSANPRRAQREAVPAEENSHSGSMTTPESLVVSLDMAKRLKEAGWKERTIFSATVTDNLVAMILTPTKGHDLGNYPVGDPNTSEILMFPTAEEILRRLPQLVNHFGLLVCRSQDNESWEVNYMGGYKPMSDPSLANAAAAMWLYLKENNLFPLTAP